MSVCRRVTVQLSLTQPSTTRRAARSVPHQEVNASDATLKCVIVRSQPATAGDAVIVNLPDVVPIDLSTAEWVDSVHPRGFRYGQDLPPAHEHEGHEQHHDHAHHHH